MESHLKSPKSRKLIGQIRWRETWLSSNVQEQHVSIFGIFQCKIWWQEGNIPVIRLIHCLMKNPVEICWISQLLFVVLLFYHIQPRPKFVVCQLGLTPQIGVGEIMWNNVIVCTCWFSDSSYLEYLPILLTRKKKKSVGIQRDPPNCKLDYTLIELQVYQIYPPRMPDVVGCALCLFRYIRMLSHSMVAKHPILMG